MHRIKTGIVSTAMIGLLAACTTKAVDPPSIVGPVVCPKVKSFTKIEQEGMLVGLMAGCEAVPMACPLLVAMRADWETMRADARVCAKALKASTPAGERH